MEGGANDDGPEILNKHSCFGMFIKRGKSSCAIREKASSSALDVKRHRNQNPPHGSGSLVSPDVSRRRLDATAHQPSSRVLEQSQAAEIF